MKTKDMKSGISLIVLIITIIVVIILAAVVILTLSKNNPIESAKEARFKEDVRTFQDELALTVSKQYANAGGHRDEKISTSDFDEIKEYIPSFSKKYKDKFVIDNDELKYKKQLGEKEKEYAQSLNIKKYKLLPDEYQQVEYIKSTGTQYINTRVFSKTEKYKVIYDMKVSEEAYGFIGANGILQLLLNRGKYYINATNGTAISTTDRHTVISEGEITNSNTNTKLTIEDKTISQTWYNDVAYGNILLFALGDKQNIYQNNKVGNIYMYSCKIIENNILIRNFIPCKSITTVTNADGKTVPANTKGLYDTVEGKFYTNQGTGEFIAGPDVNE